MTTKLIQISAEELAEQIASGEAHYLHLYNFCNVLKPRGSMKKESVGSYLYDNLMAAFESWTDPKHGDNPPVNTLMEILCTNLRDECTSALEKFFENEQVRDILLEHFPNDKK